MSPHFHRLCPPPHSSSPFCRFVSHLFTCPDVPPFSSPTSSAALVFTLPSLRLPHLFTCLDVLRRLLPLRPLGWTISPPSLHHTHLHPSVTFAALYLLQHLKVRFPAASYPPPSSSNFSRRASLTSTLPLLLQLFTSNTSRCASL